MTLIAGGSLGACGGAAKGLSAAEFVTKANAICLAVETQTKAIPVPNTAESAATGLAKVLTISEKGLADLKALDAKGDLAKTKDALTKTIAEANALLVTAEAAAKKNDMTKYSSVVDDYNKKVDEFKTQASTAQLTECAKNDTSSADTTPTSTAASPPATTPGSTPAATPSTQAPIGTPVPATAPAGSQSATSALTYVDPVPLLKSWPEHTLVPFSTAGASSFLHSFDGNAAVQQLVRKVGALTALPPTPYRPPTGPPSRATF